MNCKPQQQNSKLAKPNWGSSAIPVLPSSPAEPNATGTDAQPGENPEAGRDSHVVLQEVPTREDGVPIMVPAAHQRQCHRPGVREVPCNVKPVFEEPNAGSSHPRRLPPTPKRHGQNGGENQLPHRASIWLEPGAEQADDGMTRLVENEVGMVQTQDKSRFRTEQNEQKNSEAGGKADQLRRSDRFPFT